MFNHAIFNTLHEEVSRYGATLVAVSKTKTPNEILTVYQAGQRIFGENKVQELIPKYEQLPKDIEWHLIGHLQSNKVKYIAPFVSLIHSVDSEKLLQVISKEAVKCNRIIPCLLQVHIAEEETKFGFSEQELLAFLTNYAALPLSNVRLCGLMGMATYTENVAQVRKEFAQLAAIFKQVAQQYVNLQPHFKVLSMGMSADYRIALEEGSNMVRIGSLIFGERS
ncbi:YggS family pyridoxal phosphate-dependent enzyme [Sphingobacteriales bacterium UPWRP_1]|nr:YggS family pyridoxal phosphate enzyme [Sphingobacteriales bacterium TSM_CSS]PSJ76925.1 YggS family pyridoxal phosphate-dependent enzyme [Sphingobacteriales bacterium UPWRP_1]